MKVIVIGCGPAGLAAAHAAVGLGADVEVIAPKKKTPQNGPLLMQRPIPGINVDHPDGTIRQFVVGGTILDYRYKLYGDINIGINGDQLMPKYHAWKHGETYDKLWRMYHTLIRDRIVTATEMRHMHEVADLAISTANAEQMCCNKDFTHTFTSVTVAITQRSSYLGQINNTIVFNASPDVPWVRSSMVFGVQSTEWPITEAPGDARAIRKPIATNCDCYPHVLRTGRFGAFKNEVWIDTAYWDAYNAVEDMIRIEGVSHGNSRM